jgi:hypothetical protein
VDRYDALLAAADEPGRGDLDGRVNLGEAALVAWIEYVLDIGIDQVQFMRTMPELPAVEGRIAACLSFEQHTRRSGVRLGALRPLRYLFVSGTELERGEFMRMTGLGERTAVTLLGALLGRGCSPPTRRKARCASACRCMRCGSTSRRCGPRRKRTQQPPEARSARAPGGNPCPEMPTGVTRG